MSDLSAAVEAILFSSNRPLKVRELQQATDSSRDEVEHALDDLRSALEGRGVMVMRHHDELHLATRPAHAAAVRRALRPEVSGKLSPAAYETLLLDVMRGDQTLFTRRDGIEAQWNIVTPIEDAWAKHTPPAFPNYAGGSAGPAAADALLARNGHVWRALGTSSSC